MKKYIPGLTNTLIGFIVVISINIKNLWYWFLNFPLNNYIGKLPYGLYLWQQFFTADRPYLHILPVLLVLSTLLLCALMSYYFIERPFMKLKTKFEV